MLEKNSFRESRRLNTWSCRAKCRNYFLPPKMRKRKNKIEKALCLVMILLMVARSCCHRNRLSKWDKLNDLKFVLNKIALGSSSIKAAEGYFWQNFKLKKFLKAPFLRWKSFLVKFCCRKCRDESLNGSLQEIEREREREREKWAFRSSSLS